MDVRIHRPRLRWHQPADFSVPRLSRSRFITRSPKYPASGEAFALAASRSCTDRADRNLAPRWSNHISKGAGNEFGSTPFGSRRIGEDEIAFLVYQQGSDDQRYAD